MFLPEYEWCFVIWLAAIAVQVARTWVGRPTAGMTLACIASLALVHLVAEVCYWMAGYMSPDRLASMLGFRIAAMGILGYTLGVLLFDLITYGQRNGKSVDAVSMLNWREQYGVGIRIVLVGIVLYFTGILIGFGAIPGLSAVFGGTLTVVVSGILLNWHANRRARRPDKALMWALGLMLLPLFGVVLQGFIGFGMSAVLVASCFILGRTRIRWWSVPLGVAAVYFGLSLWITYAEVRAELRQQVWIQKSDLSSRLLFLSEKVIGQFKLLDIDDQEQLVLLERLDQNMLVGKSANYINSGGIAYAEGDTLIDALLALVPRLVWKDKPNYGGSGTVVSRYTGIRFDATTSIGVGQILELYINYGLECVFIGMMVIGLIVAAFDSMAGNCLNRGDVWGFVTAYVIAQPLMLSQGNYAEVTAAMFGGWILTRILRFIGGGWVEELRMKQ